MSDHYKLAEKALTAYKKTLRAAKYTRKQISAAHGGWEWAMEQMFDYKNDSYSVDRMDGDGSDAAGDLADGMVACGEITRREKEAYADTVYDGISAARKYVRETYGEDKR